MHDGIAALRDGMDAAPALDVEVLQQRLDTIREVLIEGLASLPLPPPRTTARCARTCPGSTRRSTGSEPR